MVLGILLLLAGLALAVPQLVRMLRLHSVCTEPVEAVCVDVEVSRHYTKSMNTSMRSRTESYFPVWEYEYGGMTYRTQDNYGNSDSDKLIGHTATLYVNPADPEQFRRSGSDPALVAVLVGAGLAVVGVLLIL